MAMPLPLALFFTPVNTRFFLEPASRNGNPLAMTLFLIIHIDMA